MSSIGMSAESRPRPPASGTASAGTASPPKPVHVEARSVALLALGFVVLYAQPFNELFHTIWASPEQSHGPIIAALALWLIWYDRAKIFANQPRPALGAGFGFVGFALLMFIVGRTQEIIMFQVGSEIPLLVGCLLLLSGWPAVRRAWFPLFFLIFMIPLPEFVVAALTGPLRHAVSVVAEGLLNAIGYPTGRTGVIITIGQYQLMVADACAGLNSMFTLESLGLLYMKLMDYKSPTRNALLAVLIVPISFVSNVIRVIVLVLVTYYFGDEAGQGFTHWLAGMVLFAVALSLIFLIDKPLNLFFKETKHARS